jgi:gluconate 2-dehydrogenase gamma chain
MDGQAAGARPQGEARAADRAPAGEAPEQATFFTEPISRARFLKSVAKAGLIGSFGAQLAAVSVVAAASAPPTPTLVTGSAADLSHKPLLFFSTAQAETIAAMAERIFPATASGPGATEARVVDYIDGQLQGTFGWGYRTYSNGPFPTPGDAFHGWQFPMSPRDMYHRGLDALTDYLNVHYGGATFASLPAATQDKILTLMSTGGMPMSPASENFFAMFQQNVIEGLFSDPVYGGNRDVIGWKWINYPGDPMAYGDIYFEYVDNFKVLYNVTPAGLAQTQY